MVPVNPISSFMFFVLFVPFVASYLWTVDRGPWTVTVGR